MESQIEVGAEEVDIDAAAGISGVVEALAAVADAAGVYIAAAVDIVAVAHAPDKCRAGVVAVGAALLAADVGAVVGGDRRRSGGCVAQS